MSGVDDLHIAKNNLMEALGDKSQEYVIFCGRFALETNVYELNKFCITAVFQVVIVLVTLSSDL